MQNEDSKKNIENIDAVNNAIDMDIDKNTYDKIQKVK